VGGLKDIDLNRLKDPAGRKKLTEELFAERSRLNAELRLVESALAACAAMEPKVYRDGGR
jgi:hypothetical protein